MSDTERDQLLQSLRNASLSEQEAQGVTHSGERQSPVAIATRGIAETAGGLGAMISGPAESAAAGVISGAASLLESGELLWDDIRNAVGAADPKLVKNTERSIKERRERRAQAIAGTKNPGVAKVAEIGTELAAFGGGGGLLSKGLKAGLRTAGVSAERARTLGSAASAATTGAVVSEDNRALGALIGGGTGFAASKGLNKLRGALKERVRPEGTTRAQAIGRDPELESKLFSKQASKAGKIPEDANIADELSTVINRNTRQVNRIKDKLYGRALSSPKVAKVKVDLKNELGEDFQTLRQNILDADIASGRNFVKRIDSLMDKPTSLKNIHDLTKTGNQLSNYLKTIKNNDVDAHEAAKQLRNRLVTFTKNKLDEIDPSAGGAFRKGKALSQRGLAAQEKLKIKAPYELELKGLVPKLVNDPSGGENIKKALYALTKDKKATHGLIIQHLYRDATKDGIFNATKFMRSIARLRNSAKVRLDPTTEKAAKNLMELHKYLDSQKQSFFERHDIPGTETTKKIINYFLDSKGGIKMLTKISSKNPRFEAIVDSIVNAAISKAAKNQVEPQVDSEREALLKALGQ
jgi:CRISPR/Cas system CSM-associated protein Csm2 small subunit